MKRCILALFVLLIGSAGLLTSQAAQKTEEKIAAPSKGKKKAVESEPTPAKSSAKSEAPTESPRVVALQKMQFDRRPSAVLKLMAVKVGADDPPGSDKMPLNEKLGYFVQTVLQAEAPLQGATLAAAMGTKMSLKDPIEVEVTAFHRDVILGHWRDVRAYLKKLPTEESKPMYAKVLQSFPSQGNAEQMQMQQMQMQMQMMMGMGGNPNFMRFAEKNAFSIEDLIGMARAAPTPLEKDAVRSLGSIMDLSLSSGVVVENIVARLKAELEDKKDPLPLTGQQIAQVVVAARQTAYAGDFLPTLEKATADKNDEALDLLAQHFLGKYGLDAKPAHLENAWYATQAVLSHGKAKKEHVEPAMKRAVELAPKVKETLGQTWLEQSFTKDRERGRELLAALGTAIGQGITTQPFSPDMRHKSLLLQKTAVEALLRTLPKGSREWESTLTMLAVGWLKEAEFTAEHGRSGRMGPRMQRDRYGNMFFYDDDDPFYQYQMRGMQNIPRPVEVGEMLETRPSVLWIEQIEEGWRPKLAMLITQLYLKGGEDKDAFPYIEKLAQTHPEKAKQLVNEFLRVWVRNHDLNESRRGYNPFIYYYGYMSRAESIPLTRSKQERNLQELTEWVARLNKLPVGDIDDELLARAFTASHSSAEVFRVELIEQVFGPVGGLKPKALAQIVQQMRENLGSIWREPAVQKDKKTNRKQKDIEAEVLRGYELALTTTNDALKKHPENWELMLVRAALKHDENNYRQEVAKSSEFSVRRDEALKDFRAAAEAYTAKALELPENETTTRAFEQWFYASLGACDIGQITEERLPDPRQPAIIKKCIESMPGEVGEKHMTKFVNSFVTKTGAVKAPVKYRYLKAGLEIVGDHKFAHEAKKSFDYYKDLVTEIRLETVVDGSDVVGHGQPFGLFVQLRHTREIERESGGFSRYLQNQNSNVYFSYNFGRPTTDYRDRFQSTVQDALKEHFDVVSVTFQNENVNSRATREYGWRITPYAYLLLKPKGPQVDKIPALKLDLDFLDTAGYVVLPIESGVRSIDAVPAKGKARPVRDLQITQTLDERQADKGKLVLEIKAVGLGLIPDLETIVDLKPEGFDITNTDDPGVAVSKFDEDSPDPAVVSQRLWTVSLQASPGQQPTSFSFGEAKSPAAKMTYQRFQDADLTTVTQKIDLEAHYGKPNYSWVGWAVGGVLVGLLALAGLLVWLLQPAPKAEPRFTVPAEVTPFSVLNLLERIQKENGLAPPQKSELASSIAELQVRYFGINGSRDMNLKELANTWVSRATKA